MIILARDVKESATEFSCKKCFLKALEHHSRHCGARCEGKDINQHETRNINFPFLEEGVMPALHSSLWTSQCGANTVLVMVFTRMAILTKPSYVHPSSSASLRRETNQGSN